MTTGFAIVVIDEDTAVEGFDAKVDGIDGANLTVVTLFRASLTPFCNFLEARKMLDLKTSSGLARSKYSHACKFL